MDTERSKVIEQGLERAAERLGDITAPVLAEFYRRFPAAKDSFVYHSPPKPELLEAEMVGNTLYYAMTWFERPDEVRFAFDSSVPHHRVALEVPPEWYAGFIEAFVDVIVPAAVASSADQAVWQELREALVGLVEGNRFI